MNKKYFAKLMICTAFACYNLNASENSTFFGILKSNPAGKVAENFKAQTPENQDKICRQIANLNASSDLGADDIGAMKWMKLKEVCSTHKYTTTVASTATVGQLDESRKQLQQTAGDYTTRYKATEVGRVDASAFTKHEAELAQLAELERKMQEFQAQSGATSTDYSKQKEEILRQSHLLLQQLALEKAEADRRLIEEQNALRQMQDMKGLHTVASTALQGKQDLQNAQAAERANINVQIEQTKEMAAELAREMQDWQAIIRQFEMGEKIIAKFNAYKAALSGHETEDRTAAFSDEASKFAALQADFHASRERALQAEQKRIADEKQREFDAKFAALSKAEAESRNGLLGAEQSVRNEMHSSLQTSIQENMRAAEERLRAMQERAAADKTAQAEALRAELVEIEHQKSEARETVDSMRTAAIMIAQELGVGAKDVLDRLSTEEIISRIENQPTTINMNGVLKQQQVNALKEQYANSNLAVKDLTTRLDELSRRTTEPTAAAAAASAAPEPEVKRSATAFMPAKEIVVNIRKITNELSGMGEVSAEKVSEIEDFFGQNVLHNPKSDATPEEKAIIRIASDSIGGGSLKPAYKLAIRNFQQIFNPELINFVKELQSDESKWNDYAKMMYRLGLWPADFLGEYLKRELGVSEKK